MKGERIVVIASADAALRQRVGASLTRMRWQVKEAQGGASAMLHLEQSGAEALLLDHWLPDLEAGTLADFVHDAYPQVDLVNLDGTVAFEGCRSARRHELLQALREAGSAAAPNSWDGAIWRTTPPTTRVSAQQTIPPEANRKSIPTIPEVAPMMLLPGLVGVSPAMQELARLVRLVAPHPARVLIEGETGSGKELVACAVHDLSSRVGKPFVALNCAAIPEALLEAELFGHTRGAFTGATQARTGRIEAADTGTLFLDEIGELPLALQAKLLRFLENGELQKIGGNEAVRVDVRILAATHRQLEERSSRGEFRLDLYHRIATFPIEVPSLRERLSDLPMLAQHLLHCLNQGQAKKRLSQSALDKLAVHPWPGNVRELQNVLQRGLILAGVQPVIEAEHIVLTRRRHSS